MSIEQQPFREPGSLGIIAPPRLKSGWTIGIGLLAPALITYFFARYGNWSDVIRIAMLLSSSAGIVCAIWTIRMRTMKLWKKILLFVVICPCFFIVSLMASLVGGAISGATR